MPRLALALLFAVLSCSSAAAEWAVSAMNTQIEQTNFVVNRGCSGTLIDLKNRYILTAEHCISDQYEIVTRESFKDDGTVVTEKVRRILPGQVQQLTFSDDQLEVRSVTYRTKLVLADREKDLALVQVIAPLPNTSAATIACTSPVRGDTVYAVGNPHSILYSSITKGIVSSVQRNYPMFGIDDQGENALMQISSGIIGGNSGGAAYNTSGELVGVPVRGSRINEIIGLAVPLDDVKRFLRRVGLEADLWGNRCPK
jgi:S1-C subfamily serine protease